MPRTRRAIQAGGFYHVLNRGNGRRRIFHKPADYLAFERILAEGVERFPADLLAYCLMPNHWHLVVCPRTHEALARFMSWVGVTHVRRHHAHYRTSGGGHLYQGRFKSFPVQDDLHFLTVCRYVEANPLRARLVKSALRWSWSSLAKRASRSTDLRLKPWPVDRPVDWLATVNEIQPKNTLAELRTSVQRGRPFGAPNWVEKTAAKLGLMFTLHPRGRPREKNAAAKLPFREKE